MSAFYTRTQSCIDIEEATGKCIEDFLDYGCFEEDEYEEDEYEEDEYEE